MSIRAEVGRRAATALTAAGIPADISSQVQWANRPDHGDLQINAALPAAKALGRNPRELAQEIVTHLDLSDLAERVEIAGPGFINIFLKNSWLSAQLAEFAQSDGKGVEKAPVAQTVVVDYSSPNLAKEMHVGHLRSTIIGDAVVRVLESLGHRVIRQNHVGDWGTQFGMLIAELEEQENDQLELKDLEMFYRQAKSHFDEDPEFAERARNYVVQLQSGDSQCLAMWQRFIDLSMQHAQEIYQKLNVTLTDADTRGESAYNDALPSIITELEAKGLARLDQGARLVYLDEVADGDGNPLPLMVQKADGGYLYGTTDLAALRYRVDELNTDRCLIFSDARQSLHMKQVFATARAAAWVDDSVELLHCAFGTMLGEDGKPFKTRSGDTVKLTDLLDEAVLRAYKLVSSKNPNLDDEEKQRVARAVGIGAVKYADLCRTRTHDYLFNWDAMLSFEGNTAPYLQYAYTRIRSLFRRAGVEPEQLSGNVVIGETAERQLALWMCRFSEVVEQVAERAYPHELCNYLYQLSAYFMTFYEECPILREGVSDEQKNSRLLLAAASAMMLSKGLELLGIETLEHM